MKKKLFILFTIFFFMIGCSLDNNPQSKIEALMMKYQKVDNDIEKNINLILDEQNFTPEHRTRYKKLLEDQYRNLSYEIKDELIDGDNATVITSIEVIDYKKAINDLNFDSTIYTKDTFDEEKLYRLENATDKVTYTIEFTLTKNDNGEWNIDALTNEQVKKIQGMY